MRRCQPAVPGQRFLATAGKLLCLLRVNDMSLTPFQRREWTILSGIVLSVEDRYIPIALGTGLKCEPYVRLSRTGDVLHDSHAEVLTRRAARRWLIHRLREEKTASLSDSSIPLLFEPADSGKYRLRGSIDLHWYISALPCT